jgi:hypothetical protein
MTQHNDIQLNGIQHKGLIFDTSALMTLSIMTLHRMIFSMNGLCLTLGINDTQLDDI